MTEDEKKFDRVNMNFPVGLKDEVKDRVGARGVTPFVVEAVQTRLADEDRVKELQKEVDELRYLAQLLADRYVMGGDHENRESFLMEVALPSWMRTDGWPADLARLVPKKDPVPEAVGERVPTQPPAPIGLPVRHGDDEVVVVDTETTTTYTEADLRAPSYAVAQKVSEEYQEGGFVQDAPDLEPVQTPVETPAPMGRENPSYVAPSDSFLAKVQAAAASKGIDLGGAGLRAASTVQTPEKPNVHNHSWIRHDDGMLHCDCGAFIDERDKESHPNGIVREPGWTPTDSRWDAPTEPEPTYSELAQQTPKAEAPFALGTEPEVIPEYERAVSVGRLPVEEEEPYDAAPNPAPITRSLDDFDVDF